MFKTPDCCKSPSVANLDHKKGFEPEVVEMVNRVCLQCKAHWYGPHDSVKQYTGKEWDAWVQQTFIEITP